MSYGALKTDVLRRELLKKVLLTENPHGDFRMQRVGLEDVAYTVEIDWDCVRSMAHKAARSAGGKSKQGPVRVKVTGRKAAL